MSKITANQQKAVLFFIKLMQPRFGIFIIPLCFLETVVLHNELIEIIIQAPSLPFDDALETLLFPQKVSLVLPSSSP